MTCEQNRYKLFADHPSFCCVISSALRIIKTRMCDNNSDKMVEDNDIKNWCMSMRISVAMVKVMVLACKLVGVKAMKEAAVGVFF